jgi:uncharacterized membrane protein
MTTVATDEQKNLNFLALSAVLVAITAAPAGFCTGAFWESAGWLIGLAYWGLYITALAMAVLMRKGQIAIGMAVALFVAVPVFYGLAVAGAMAT